RPHDVFQSGAQTIHGALDIFQNLNSLRVGIVDSYDLAVVTERRGARDINSISDAYGSRVTDKRLPFCAGRNLLPFRHGLGSRIMYSVGQEYVRSVCGVAEPYWRQRPTQPRSLRQSSYESTDLTWLRCYAI